MIEYLMYFYDRYGIIDSYKFKSSDDYTARIKGERIFNMMAYTSTKIMNQTKCVGAFKK